MAYGIDIAIELELSLNGNYAYVVGKAEYDVFLDEGFDLSEINVELSDENGEPLGVFCKREGELFDAVKDHLEKGSYVADKISEARI